MSLSLKSRNIYLTNEEVMQRFQESLENTCAQYNRLKSSLPLSKYRIEKLRSLQITISNIEEEITKLQCKINEYVPPGATSSGRKVKPVNRFLEEK